MWRICHSLVLSLFTLLSIDAIEGSRSLSTNLQLNKSIVHTLSKQKYYLAKEIVTSLFTIWITHIVDHCTFEGLMCLIISSVNNKHAKI